MGLIETIEKRVGKKQARSFNHDRPPAIKWAGKRLDADTIEKRVNNFVTWLAHEAKRFIEEL